MYLVMLMIRTRKERKKVLFPKKEIYNIEINLMWSLVIFSGYEIWDVSVAIRTEA